MITIKEYYSTVKDIDESILAMKSDSLWKKGSVLDIKNGWKQAIDYIELNR